MCGIFNEWLVCLFQTVDYLKQKPGNKCFFIQLKIHRGFLIQIYEMAFMDPLLL